MFDFSIKILVADDMLTMRKLVKNALNDIGYKNIIEAEDGKHAQKLLQENQDVALIISDWNMPNSNGLELLELVRASDKMEEIPFIMLTAEAGVEQVTKALQAGVDSYIVKPFSGDGLKKKIEATYKKRMLSA